MARVPEWTNQSEVGDQKGRTGRRDSSLLSLVMAALIACCAMDAACGAAKMTLNCLCCSLPWNGAVAARFVNSLLFLSLSILSFFLHEYGEESVIAFPKYEDVVCGVECYRFYVVYKIAVGLFIYYAVQSLALIGINSSEQPRSILHEGFWPVKVALLIGSVIGCCFIPRWLLDYAFYPALFASILFILAQSILLVEFAYDLVEGILEKAEDHSAWSWLLIGMTLAMYALMGTGTVFLFLWYPDNWSRTIMIVNATLSIILTVIGILPAVQEANPSAGIFQSSLLGLYGLFLVCSAILSNPANHTVEGGLATAMKIGSFIFACLCILYSARNTAKQGASKLGVSDGDSDGMGDFNYSWYHLTFASASLYMALIASGWRLAQVSGTGWSAIDTSLAWWLKVSTAALIYLLYGWSLFAPMILTDRQF